MGIGDLRRGDDLFLRGVLHPEGDVVEDGVVEQDRVLVHVPHETAEVFDLQALDVFSVDGDPAFRRVVEAGDEVHEGGFSGAGFAYDRDHLSARDFEVHALEHFAPAFVGELDPLEGDPVAEVFDTHRVGRLPDGIFRLEDAVDALHRRQSLGDAVGGAGEFLDGLDHRVEDDHEEDELRGVHEAAAEQALAPDDQVAAEGEDRHDHHRPEEFADGVGRCLARVHPVDLPAHPVGDALEAVGHLLFCIEGLDDAETAQGFLHLGHGVAPEGLRLQGLALELLADDAHHPDEGGDEGEHDEHHFRAQEHQEPEIQDDQDRVLDKHFDGGGDGGFHLVHVTAHPGDDVTLAFLGEKADGKVQDLVVDAVPDVLDDAGADGDHHGGGPEVAGSLEGREEDHDGAKEQQGRDRPVLGGEVGYQPVGVVHEGVLERVSFRPPGDERVLRRIQPEQDVQQRNDDCEGKDIEYGGEDVQDDRPGQVTFVGEGVLPHHFKEIAHPESCFR